MKAEPKDEAELKEDKNKEKKMEKQTKLFHKYRTTLAEFRKPNFEELLRRNSQEVPTGLNEVNKS